MRRWLACLALGLCACPSEDPVVAPAAPEVVRAAPGSIEDPILAERARELVARAEANPMDAGVHVELGLSWDLSSDFRSFVHFFLVYLTEIPAML